MFSVQGSGRAAMGARAVWTEATRPWIPGSWWKASSAVYFKVERMCEASAFGYVVEPDFPVQLRIRCKSRHPHILDVPLAVHGVSEELVEGQVYAMCGTSGSIFRDGCWEFVAPSLRFSTGICCILGWRTLVRAMPAPGLHTAEVTASRGDSGSASAVKALCGFVDVAGKFHSCPPPESETTVRGWLEQWVPSGMLDVAWFSFNGKWMDPETSLGQHEAILVRLLLRLRGGAKSKSASDDLQKLRKHLASKGVPDEALDQRIAQVQQVVTPEQLSAVYQSLDPWQQLKSAVHQRMRLVTAEELRNHKAKLSKQGSGVSDTPDPWAIMDPWKEGRRTPSTAASSSGQSHSSETEPLIDLIPEFFCCEDGTHPKLLQHVSNGCSGMCLLPIEEAEMLCSLGKSISADECGVVVVGTTPPKAGNWPCVALTFVAKHAQAGKILIKGFLLNLGDKAITVQTDDDVLTMPSKDTQVITIEISKQHVDDWSAVQQNAMRYAWQSIAGLQKATLGS